MQLPDSWQPILQAETAAPYFQELADFVRGERRRHQVFPAETDVFAALQQTPPEKVRVVLLGQDPYHDVGQAHGMCFSVKPGVKPPPSLVNIFKELRDDLGVPTPRHGCLDAWAKQGVLLLNAVLTVRAHEPLSHRNRGWETFTDAILRSLNARLDPLVFLLWGKPAQRKKPMLDAQRHAILESAHPSPLSARKGFLGSKPFSKTNALLTAWGGAPIDWSVP